MSFLKRLFSTPARAGSGNRYPIAVRCQRCDEVIRSEVNLSNDLSIDYGEDGDGPRIYRCRKVLVGNQRCFQPIEVNLTFDVERHLIDKQVIGGTFVEDNG